MRTTLEGKIDRIEGNVAVVILENQKQLLLPIDKMDLDFRAGQLITISLIGGEAEYAVAKDYLNEILEGEKI